MRREVRIERSYNCPPTEVWRAIATREALAAWLMPNDFEPRVGHRFTFRTKPAPGFDGIIHCLVVEVDPPSRLAFTWSGGGVDTRVRFELRPEAEGTRLVFVHEGFEGLRGLLLGRMLGNGWRAKLATRLPAVLGMPASGGTAPGAEPGASTFWRAFNRIFKRSAAALLLSGFAASSAGAQPTAPRIAQTLSTTYVKIMDDVVAASEILPEADYAFRPSPEVRTFGQIVAHLGGSQFLYCSSASKVPLDQAVRSRLGALRPYANGQPTNAPAPSKAALVSLLRDGVSYCARAIEALTDTEALAPGKEGRLVLTPLLENIAHANLHYGNLVTYLRIKGLVPPSTAVKGSGRLNDDLPVAERDRDEC